MVSVKPDNKPERISTPLQNCYKPSFCQFGWVTSRPRPAINRTAVALESKFTLPSKVQNLESSTIPQLSSVRMLELVFWGAEVQNINVHVNMQ